MSFDDIITDAPASTAEEGAAVAARILDYSNPTCFIAMSDAAAMGILDVLESRSLDISVVGFDGLEDGLCKRKRLTTIYQSGKEKGLKSAEILFRLIDGDENTPLYTLLPYTFREGTTLKEFR